MLPSRIGTKINVETGGWNDLGEEWIEKEFFIREKWESDAEYHHRLNKRIFKSKSSQTEASLILPNCLPADYLEWKKEKEEEARKQKELEIQMQKIKLEEEREKEERRQRIKEKLERESAEYLIRQKRKESKLEGLVKNDQVDPKIREQAGWDLNKVRKLIWKIEYKKSDGYKATCQICGASNVLIPEDCPDYEDHLANEVGNRWMKTYRD